MDSRVAPVLAVKLGAAAFFIIALGAAGNMDMADAEASEAEYKNRVCAGVHSDYLDLGVSCGD
jgi:hypothetical protein